MNKLTKANPLHALIQCASKLPSTTGAVAHYERRLASAGTEQVVLADVSSSMSESAGSRTRIEVLRDALFSAPIGRLIAFGSTPREIASAAVLPRPSGGTALHLALDLAGTMRPARTLVISDGEPDDERKALESAVCLSGTIDVIYCGPDSDIHARDFLMRLARAGGGRYVAHDLRRAHNALAPSIRAMLTIGKP